MILRLAIGGVIFAAGLFLVLGAFGIAGMREAVFGDVGVALIAAFNAIGMLIK